ncbi:unnamed protein product [Pleuronectes platessa]|uniref:Uncharacterized protein n=1 Tax=Pleuronectes platessa TaxID=8262 RepID=A0A9N7YZX5_PLEPL|nr:unnamed protein product [Pleuronectes platessa]
MAASEKERGAAHRTAVLVILVSPGLYLNNRKTEQHNHRTAFPGCVTCKRLHLNVTATQEPVCTYTCERAPHVHDGKFNPFVFTPPSMSERDGEMCVFVKGEEEERLDAELMHKETHKNARHLSQLDVNASPRPSVTIPSRRLHTSPRGARAAPQNRSGNSTNDLPGKSQRAAITCSFADAPLLHGAHACLPLSLSPSRPHTSASFSFTSKYVLVGCVLWKCQHKRVHFKGEQRERTIQQRISQGRGVKSEGGGFNDLRMSAFSVTLTPVADAWHWQAVMYCVEVFLSKGSLCHSYTLNISILILLKLASRPEAGLALTSNAFSKSSSFWFSSLSDSSEQLSMGSEVGTPEVLQEVEVTVEGEERGGGGEADGEKEAAFRAVVAWNRTFGQDFMDKRER